MFRYLKRSSHFVLIIFIFPALVHWGVWSTRDLPNSWREANWSSAGVLNPAPLLNQSAVYLMSARTGGTKGAFATHSWIVIKKAGRATYDRYDVVGWGRPVRKNAYDADANWYSNPPTINHQIVGETAASLIPKIENAIATYRWNRPGDYTIWPGPNSNTFVANVVASVPELAVALPSTAVGRDYPADGRWFGCNADGSYFVSAGGYAGLVVGIDRGLEINFLGLVAGISPLQGAIKVPAFGTYRLI